MLLTLLLLFQLGPLFERAAQSLQSGDFEAAERDLIEARKLAPTNPAVLSNLGVVYSKTERYGKAVEAYQAALKSRPGDPRLLINLGLAHLKQEEYRKALPLFRKVQTPQARELEAGCLIFTGEPRKAIQLPARSIRSRSSPCRSSIRPVRGRLRA